MTPSQTQRPLHAAMLALAALMTLALSIAPASARAQDAIPLITRHVEPDRPLDWPDRLSLRGAQEGEKGLLIEIPAAPDRVLLPRQVPPGVLVQTSDDRAHARILEEALNPPRTLRAEGPRSYVFFAADRPRAASRRGPQAEAHAVFLSAAPAAPDLAQLQRTWFTLYAPIAAGPAEHAADPVEHAQAQGPRGIVLIMPGVFGEPRPGIDALVLLLQRRGWVVLRMLAQSSRFTEAATFDIDAADPGPGVRAASAEMTDRAAECAYAVQAALRWAIERHPAAADRPIYAIGMSGGALTLPAVLARQPERFAGAVLIAGGAEWLSLTDRSVYKQWIGALEFAWNPALPTDEQRQAASEAFLSATPLDAYHTAALLRGKRLLVIHGQFDLAVPAPNGELLWQRLGRPERWTVPGGHEAVFIWLGRNLPALADWLDARPMVPEGVRVERPNDHNP